MTSASECAAGGAIPLPPLYAFTAWTEASLVLAVVFWTPSTVRSNSWFVRHFGCPTAHCSALHCDFHDIFLFTLVVDTLVCPGDSKHRPVFAMILNTFYLYPLSALVADIHIARCVCLPSSPATEQHWMHQTVIAKRQLAHVTFGWPHVHNDNQYRKTSVGTEPKISSRPHKFPFMSLYGDLILSRIIKHGRGM